MVKVFREVDGDEIVVGDGRGGRELNEYGSYFMGGGGR